MPSKLSLLPEGTVLHCAEAVESKMEERKIAIPVRGMIDIELIVSFFGRERNLPITFSLRKGYEEKGID